MLKKVLDAGDTYNGSLESRPLFIQADSLGERASSILRELEAGQQMLEMRIALLAASGFVGAVATLSMVGAVIDPTSPADREVRCIVALTERGVGQIEN